MAENELQPKKILVAVAWPYANGSLHLGHIAGAYLPADIFARYHRLRGDRVLMVSGSDCHGTPITVRAESESSTPDAIAHRFHPAFVDYWTALNIAFDLYTTTLTPNHAETVAEVFQKLDENGFIERRSTVQLFDEAAGRFLPDRYVTGRCPLCGSDGARGDQCESCGKTLDPTQLVDPVSRLTGTAPVPRMTEHYFFRLSSLQGKLHDWILSRRGWRRAVQKWAESFVAEGLLDRPITRDLDWGVPIPESWSLGPTKCFYVWFEAVIGYLSATKEWAIARGNPEEWREWWCDPATASYYFVGKDNIPFHTVVWPGILLAHGELNLPTNVPANQYVTFGGRKASKSSGVGLPVEDYLSVVEADSLRFAVARSLPETGDTELTNDEIARQINNELVATWGNLVNRVKALVKLYFDGAIPPRGQPGDEDSALLARGDALIGAVGAAIEDVKLRKALQEALKGASEVNLYLNRTQPWHTVRANLTEAGTVLNVALHAIANINVALAPFIPNSSEALHRALTGEILAEHGWACVRLRPGHVLTSEWRPFQRVEVSSLPNGSA